MQVSVSELCLQITHMAAITLKRQRNKNMKMCDFVVKILPTNGWMHYIVKLCMYMH